MSTGAISFNEQNFECYTPKYIVDMFGAFDYDPATTEEQAKALGIPNYSTIDTDGLKQDWAQFKRIWINPPFYLKFPFLEKAVSTYKRAGNDIYFLAPVSILTAKKIMNLLKELASSCISPMEESSLEAYIKRGKKPHLLDVLFLNSNPRTKLSFLTLLYRDSTQF